MKTTVIIMAALLAVAASNAEDKSLNDMRADTIRAAVKAAAVKSASTEKPAQTATVVRAITHAAPRAVAHGNASLTPRGEFAQFLRAMERVLPGVSTNYTTAQREATNYTRPR